MMPNYITNDADPQVLLLSGVLVLCVAATAGAYTSLAPVLAIAAPLLAIGMGKAVVAFNGMQTTGLFSITACGKAQGVAISQSSLQVG
jgi:hypothetical protein